MNTSAHQHRTIIEDDSACTLLPLHIPLFDINTGTPPLAAIMNQVVINFNPVITFAFSCERLISQYQIQHNVLYRTTKYENWHLLPLISTHLPLLTPLLTTHLPYITSSPLLTPSSHPLSPPISSSHTFNPPTSHPRPPFSHNFSTSHPSTLLSLITSLPNPPTHSPLFHSDHLFAYFLTSLTSCPTFISPPSTLFIPSHLTPSYFLLPSHHPHYSLSPSFHLHIPIIYLRISFLPIFSVEFETSHVYLWTHCIIQCSLNMSLLH